MLRRLLPLLIAMLPAMAASGQPLDLTHAVVVTASRRGVVERSAARMLVEEVAKRCGITMRTSAAPPATGPVIFLGTRANLPAGLPRASGRRAAKAEGYRVHIGRVGGRTVVTAIGVDAPGCVFAAGRLLREFRMQAGRIAVPPMNVETAPAQPVRGHHIDWGFLGNTYDLWNDRQFEQYVRDLAIWGANAIELLPIESGRTLEASLATNARWADIAAAYGMRVWIWTSLADTAPPGSTGAGLTPGQTVCTSQPDGGAYLLEVRRRLFERIRHVDAVYLVGGDPAGCTCDRCKPWSQVVMRNAEAIARIARRTHPAAQMWISNQGFGPADNALLYRRLRRERPAWLTGLVHGPWAEQTIAEMRAAAPAEYRIRQYPDFTHTVRCQYPAQNWDIAYAQTLGRESPMYRLEDHAHIARLFQPMTCGAIGYSEGVNDDLHKIVWSARMWDPDVAPARIAREYARCFFGGALEEAGTQGILGLDRNWRGPLLANRGVTRTLAVWRAIEARGGARLQGNWRFQMALLRAMYDAYVQLRLQADTAAEQRTLAELERAGDPQTALRTALQTVQAARAAVVEPAMRDRMFTLGQALHDTIGMQLSVARWGALGIERGAILDTLDAPITNLAWLERELQALQAAADPGAARAGIRRIVEWDRPGPGGYYDDLGNPSRQPHLVRPVAWRDDPGYLRSPRTCFTGGAVGSRMSWLDYAETLYDTPLTMRYTGLDPRAAYTVRAVYSGRYKPVMTLTASNRWTVHGPVRTPPTPTVLEWPVPRGATATGELTLRWDRVEGRGCEVSEVWLVRSDAGPGGPVGADAATP